MRTPPTARVPDRLAAVLPFVMLSLGITPPAVTQCTIPATGIGRETYSAVLPVITGLVNHSGVTFIGGEIFVAGFDNSTGLYAVAKYDPASWHPTTNPAVILSMPTSLVGNPVSWQLLTTDGANLIALGLDSVTGLRELHYVDTNGVPVTSIQAATGLQSLSAPAVNVAFGSPSALAFDPNGNAGTGVICALSGSSMTVERAELDATIMPSASFSPGASLVGLETDPLSDHLWTNDAIAASSLEALDEFEYPADFAGGLLTSSGASLCVDPSSIFTTRELALVPGSLDPLEPPGGSDMLVLFQTDAVKAFRLRTIDPALRTSFGTGCGAAPPPAVPTLWSSAVFDDGSDVTLSMTDVPAPFISVAMLGITPLLGGLPLDSIGMPGCNLYIASSLTSFPLSISATATTTIPVGPGFAGLTLYWQGAALAPGVNPFGIVTSNGLCWAFP